MSDPGFDPIVYVDTSRIEEGAIEPLREALTELAEHVEDNVPRAIAYHAYIDEAEERMTVIQVHPDAASLAHHMDVSGDLFPRFADLLELESIDVYGSPGKELVARLEEKARMLGTGSVGVHERHAGFGRWTDPQSS